MAVPYTDVNTSLRTRTHQHPRSITRNGARTSPSPSENRSMHGSSGVPHVLSTSTPSFGLRSTRDASADTHAQSPFTNSPFCSKRAYDSLLAASALRTPHSALRTPLVAHPSGLTPRVRYAILFSRVALIMHHATPTRDTTTSISTRPARLHLSRCPPRTQS